jgi:hypothetical protein
MPPDPSRADLPPERYPGGEGLRTIERAERFRESAGFVETCRREGIAMGRKVNTVRVMAKPLAGGHLGDYLARVACDRPDAP